MSVKKQDSKDSYEQFIWEQSVRKYPVLKERIEYWTKRMDVLSKEKPKVAATIVPVLDGYKKEMQRIRDRFPGHFED